MSELTKRNISSVAVIAVVVAAIFFGRTGLALFSVVACFVMMFEYNRAVGSEISVLSYISATILFLYSYVLQYGVTTALGVIVILYMMYFVFSKYCLHDIALSAFSVVYIALPTLCAMLLFTYYGIRVFLMAIIIPMATDIFAFVVGKTMGKNKLLPSISPKKTVEGSVGGILASAIFLSLYTYFVYPRYFAYSFLIGAVFSVLAQVGDLAASKIKREMGIKDFGNIIPGHGGVLDRLDSYLLVFPMMYTVFWVVF